MINVSQKPLSARTGKLMLAFSWRQFFQRAFELIEGSLYVYADASVSDREKK